MISGAAEWLATVGHAELANYVDRREFVTAAGLPANRKIELDPEEGSPFYNHTVQAIGEWAVWRGIAVLTAAPNGPNPIVHAAAARHKLPFVAFRKSGETFAPVPDFDLNNGRAILEKDKGRIGIVDDVRSTGWTMLRYAHFLEVVGSRSVEGLVIADRGIPVPGIHDVEEARAYSEAHPDHPPAHIGLPFPCTPLINYPLPLWVDGKPAGRHENRDF